MKISVDHKDTNFITGLCGMAACFVVLIHSGGAGLREINQFTNNFVDFCRNAVYIFFVISGYRSAISFRNQGSNFQKYLVRRFFRIAPLYWFWITVTCLSGLTANYWLNEFGSQVNTYNIIMHFLFISFLDYRVTNTLIGVEWMIPIQAFYYLLIPILMKFCNYYINTIVNVIYLFIYLFIYYILCQKIITQTLGLNHLAFEWGIFPYLTSFLMGTTAFKIRNENVYKNLIISNTVLAFSIILCILLITFPSMAALFYNNFFVVSIMTFLLIIFGNDKSYLYRVLFVNPIMLTLGTLSYGIYLSHLPLMQFILNIEKTYFNGKSDMLIIFILVLSLSVLIAYITYILIEKPATKIENFFNKIY